MSDGVIRVVAFEDAEVWVQWIRKGGTIIAEHRYRLDQSAPRCETCKLWEGREGDRLTGLCHLREDPSAKLWPEGYDGLITAHDFGCVQWQAK